MAVTDWRTPMQHRFVPYVLPGEQVRANSQVQA